MSPCGACHTTGSEERVDCLKPRDKTIQTAIFFSETSTALVTDEEI